MSTTGLRTGTRMSLDEFLDLGETDGKLELDDGVLYIMSSGTRDHQFLGSNSVGTSSTTLTVSIYPGSCLSRDDHHPVA